MHEIDKKLSQISRLSRLGRVNEARHVCRQTFSVTTAARDYQRLGKHSLQLGLPRAAVVILDFACEIFPDSQELLSDLGFILGLIGNNQASIQAYLRALRIAPGSQEICYALGLEYARQNSIEQAMAVLKDVELPNQYLSDIYNAFGNASRRLERKDMAERYFSEALKLKPHSVVAWKNLAELGRINEEYTAASDKHEVNKCRVLIVTKPRNEYLAPRCLHSVETALEHSRGVFRQIKPERIDVPDGNCSFTFVSECIEKMASFADDWLLVLNAESIVRVDIFEMVSGYLQSFDVIWGQNALHGFPPEPPHVLDNQVRFIDGVRDLVFSEPRYLLSMNCFVRPDVARTAMQGRVMFEVYLDIWNRFRCIKIPDYICSIEGPVDDLDGIGASLDDWKKAIDSIVCNYCEENEIVVDVELNSVMTRFRIHDPRDLIQQHHITGHFYEFCELEFMRDNLKKGSVIIDVGSNIGNHALYLSRHTDSAIVYVVEPNPEAIRILIQNVELNGDEKICLDWLGKGIGSCRGFYSISNEISHNLGAARLKEATEGDIEVLPLDELASGLDNVDFIKIDTEHMEIDVLNGARVLLDKYRPAMFVEVMNDNTQKFFSFLDETGYRVLKEFTYPGTVNYYVLPV